MKPLTKVDLELYEIKRLIEKGWCQGEYTDGKGNICIWEAIRLATGDEEPKWGPVAWRLEKTLAKRPWLPQSLMLFNDTSTKEQVLGLVREALSDD